MSFVPDIIPISDLRQDAAGIIRRLKSSKKPIVITQRGRAAAVLVSAEDYERTQHELEILKAIAQGELEIEQGEGADLDSVFAKAEELLYSGELEYASRQVPSDISSQRSNSSGAIIHFVARSFRNRALKSLRLLKDFPESGRHIREFPDLPYREVIVAPYRFFYREKGGAAWIVNVWHDTQLPNEPNE